MHEKAGIKESGLTQQGILHIGAILTIDEYSQYKWLKLVSGNLVGEANRATRLMQSAPLTKRFESYQIDQK